MLLWITVGIIIGWNLPQPSWAKAAQAWVVAKWNEFTNRNNA